MENITLEMQEYARELLKKCGCNEHTYGGKWANKVLDDLKRTYRPGELKYPYIDVANAILSISHPELLPRPKRYRLIWETEHDSGILGEADTLEEAKDIALGCYIDWTVDEISKWESDEPTTEDIERFNNMICNASVWFSIYVPDTDTHNEFCGLTQEELDEIGWKEIEEV